MRSTLVNQPSTVDSIRVALLGCGTVGAQVVQLMHRNATELTARIGAPLELAGIAVRSTKDRSSLPCDPALFTTDVEKLINRSDVDIVIEVIGGVSPLDSWLSTALRSGKSVVTANKALLATQGAALHEAAAAGNADLYYEAAVAGAIPLLRSLRESLHGDQIFRVLGIVNGTTNYILSNMDSNDTAFTENLQQAIHNGFAESDPSADIEGTDAAAKAAILASLAFHTPVTDADVYREGITHITPADIQSAHDMGCTIKLLAIAELITEQTGQSSVGVRVHPAMISRHHPLANVGGAFNAVFVEAQAAGQLMFYGRGAGGAPTASAVLGDVVVVARNRVAGVRATSDSVGQNLRIRDIGEAHTRYYVRLDVDDRPGVLAAIASVFAEHGVSIATVRQEGRGDDAILILVTHAAPEAALSATVTAVRTVDAVRDVLSVLRVEN